MTETTAVPILEVDGLCVNFGGVRALSECSFKVTRGCTALIGPNGSGKSTALAVIAGFRKQHKGSVALFGSPLSGSPHARARHGVVKTFQLPQEFGRMTVFENLMIGMDATDERRWLRAFLGKRAWIERERSTVERAAEIIELLELGRVSNEYASDLSGGEKKLLELGRALMRGAKVVLLDEPFAGVARPIAMHLAAVLKELTASNLKVLLVEHDMARVQELAEEVIVLAQGSSVFSGSFDEVRRSVSVKDLYLGRLSGV